VPFRCELFGQTEFMLYGPGEFENARRSGGADRTSGPNPTRRNLIAEVEAVRRHAGVAGSPIPRIRQRESWSESFAARGDMSRDRPDDRGHWWAPTVGLSRLELFVMTSNVRAIALYERLGFQVEDRRRRAYIVNGVEVDDYLMSYIFEA
jgi:hypothetical protein